MTLFITILLAFSLVFFRAYRNTYDVHTRYVSVTIQPSAHVPAPDEFPPLSILHLSDLHMENLSVDAKRIVNDFSGHCLDLIAITGDLLDRQSNIPKALAYVETVMRLKPRYGTFVVFGNHDYLLPKAKLAQLRSELEALGCRVLVNQHVTVTHEGQPLHIIGVDDFGSRHSDLARSFQDVPEKGVRLVLTHDPNLVLHMGSYHFDYLLSGHFHGGQIHWPRPYHLVIMGKLPRLNMVKGLHFVHDRPFYISEGLGQTGLNIRLRSRPEITVHTLSPHAATEAEAAREAAPALASGRL